MSQNNTQNSKKLRNVTIMLLLIIIAIFTLGIFTRYPSTINRLSETEQAIIEVQESLMQIRSQLDEIKERLNAQQDAMNILQEDIENLELKLTVKPEPLKGPALYASYADEIVSNIYPDIPSEYVKAIIWNESRYQPWRVNSSTNARGLMQIRPKWHAKRAENLGVTDLLDPYGNILVGCDILNELTQQHDFNYALNFFAGGYPYVDRYKNSVSPFVKELNEIIQKMESGEIVLEGATSVS